MRKKQKEILKKTISEVLMNCPICKLWYPATETRCRRCSGQLEKDNDSVMAIDICIPQRRKQPKKEVQTEPIDSPIGYCKKCGDIGPVGDICYNCDTGHSRGIRKYEKMPQIEHDDTREERIEKRELEKIFKTWNTIVDMVRSSR